MQPGAQPLKLDEKPAATLTKLQQKITDTRKLLTTTPPEVLAKIMSNKDIPALYGKIVFMIALFGRKDITSDMIDCFTEQHRNEFPSPEAFEAKKSWLKKFIAEDPEFLKYKDLSDDAKMAVLAEAIEQHKSLIIAQIDEINVNAAKAFIYDAMLVSNVDAKETKGEIEAVKLLAMEEHVDDDELELVQQLAVIATEERLKTVTDDVLEKRLDKLTETIKNSDLIRQKLTEARRLLMPIHLDDLKKIMREPKIMRNYGQIVIRIAGFDRDVVPDMVKCFTDQHKHQFPTLKAFQWQDRQLAEDIKALAPFKLLSEKDKIGELNNLIAEHTALVKGVGVSDAYSEQEFILDSILTANYDDHETAGEKNAVRILAKSLTINDEELALIQELAIITTEAHLKSVPQSALIEKLDALIQKIKVFAAKKSAPSDAAQVGAVNADKVKADEKLAGGTVAPRKLSGAAASTSEFLAKVSASESAAIASAALAAVVNPQAPAVVVPPRSESPSHRR